MIDEVSAAKAAYDQMARTYESHVAIRAHYLRRTRRFLRRFAKPGQRVLDLGCGTGLITRHLRDEDVVGLDLSPKMLEVARHFRPGRVFVEQDFHQPFAQHGPFDAIVAVSALEFCHDLPLLCRNIAAALKPGGRALITPVHRVHSQPRSELVSRRFPGLTLHAYDLEDGAAAIAAAGLTAVSQEIARGWNSGQHTWWYRFWTALGGPQRGRERMLGEVP